MRSNGMRFIYEKKSPQEVFTPEDFTEEHQMIQSTTEKFVKNRVLPNRESIENQDFELTVELLHEAGSLGLLAHSVPEKYEGLGLDKISKAIVGELIGSTGSYAVAQSNHTCIATLPITYFGTDQQKKKYLPKLANGEYLGAYCLTESSAGSDALSAKTTAVLNKEGTHYILNGEKQWITNAGFAETFIVYANVDGNKFTAFIVEKKFPGLSLGAEEKKMGIKGSSTRTVIFEDCKVPRENLLGKVGKGHVIALNVLNLGRFNVGATCLGASKSTLETTVKYTNERKQFGQSISEFRATQEKLADMCSRIYALESLQYRTAGLIEHSLNEINDESDSGLIQKRLMEYAAESSICKVFGSEVLDYVVDEGVQLHGGYGYMQDYSIEQMYRDSRIFRIFEGTNEINRLFITNMIYRKVNKGELDLQEAVNDIFQNVDNDTLHSNKHLEREINAVFSMRRVILMLTKIVFEKFGENFKNEQETLLKLSNLVIYFYAIESTVLRTQKAIENKGVSDEPLGLKIKLTINAVYDLFMQFEINVKKLINGLDLRSSFQKYYNIIEREIMSYQLNDGFTIKRDIAETLIKKEQLISTFR